MATGASKKGVVALEALFIGVVDARIKMSEKAIEMIAAALVSNLSTIYHIEQEFNNEMHSFRKNGSRKSY
jgi:hypothetical protein